MSPKWTEKGKKWHFSYKTDQNCGILSQIMYKWFVLTKPDIAETFSCLNDNLLLSKIPKMSPKWTKKGKNFSYINGLGLRHA